MPTPKWAKEEIEQAKDYVVDMAKDAGTDMKEEADSWLDTLRSSRWMSAIVIAAAMVIAGVLWSLL